MNNNNHNSTCKFAEQVVSYLYDEISEPEKTKVETHLQNCASCAEEISGFALVRASIQEWRTEDFAHLSTPAFETGVRKSEPAIAASWTDSLRAFFSLRQMWLTASVVAVLAICAGLYWYSVSSPQHDTIAENGNVKKAVPSASVDTVSQNSAVAKHDEQKHSDDSVDQKVTDVKNTSPKDTDVKPIQTTFDNRQPVKVIKKTGPANVERINKTVPKPVNKNKVPSLTDDEDEDTSLRLSDIFEEVSLR